MIQNQNKINQKNDFQENKSEKISEDKKEFPAIHITLPQVPSVQTESNKENKESAKQPELNITDTKEENKILGTNDNNLNVKKEDKNELKQFKEERKGIFKLEESISNITDNYEEGIKKLSEMGLTKEQAKDALKKSEGNIENAVNIFFSQQTLESAKNAPYENQKTTEHDNEAIRRLMALGVSEERAKQAYLSSLRNEDLAANLLFDEIDSKR